jgi:predicted heme/steroid binding protein
VGAAIATLLVSPRLQRAAASQGRRTATSQEQYQAQGRMTVRYGGKVYDVTGSRLWPEGRHMKQHDAWQDLTEALTRAPHGPQVLERFTVVEDGGDEPPPSVQRVFLVMVYVNACLMATVVLVVAIW